MDPDIKHTASVLLLQGQSDLDLHSSVKEASKTFHQTTKQMNCLIGALKVT